MSLISSLSLSLSLGTSVIQVTATDADDPTYGNSAKLVYSVIQGQQYFTVDPQSGVRSLLFFMIRNAIFSIFKG